MHIFGYSERGALSALFYEIGCSGSSATLLTSLLALARFPLRTDEPISIANATVFLEQSLSGFGSADAIMLLDTDDGPATVFLEAKVKSSSRASWRIQSEYQQFIEGTKSKVSSSNLFTQLYHKVRFVNGLRHGDIKTLQKGLEFPASSTRRTRSIGSNSVVLRAVGEIQPFLEDVLYLTLLPDDAENVAEFFGTTLAASVPNGYDEWSTRDYGFLCWSDIEGFCQSHRLLNTMRVLDFNKGQIY